MQRILFTIVGLGLLLAAAAPGIQSAPAAKDYIVALKSMPHDRSSYQGEAVTGANDAIRFLKVHASNPEAFERRLAHDGNVVTYEEDLEQYHISVAPNDPLYASYQYDLQESTTNMSAAWAVTTGSASAKVCVVDTGQFRGHQDFVGTHWAEWKDFVGGKSAAYDDNGHGTHVTGTIAAVSGNGKGIAGIAQVSVAGAKVLNRQGSGTNSAVANGITWCADIGAHVISMSLGGGYSSTIESAVHYAATKGVLIVAAAGNDGPCTNCVEYPGKLAEVLAVSCTDASNQLCSFSSQGPEVDLAAPGKSTASTYPALQPCTRKDTNCYLLMSGTSMSTPHVAALAALVKSAHPTDTAAELRAAMMNTARDLGTPGADQQFGAGLIQGAAVQ